MLGLLGYGTCRIHGLLTISNFICVGGTLVSQGAITVGDLTSLLLYTVYVGSGLQMLT
jgi:putative ABC transport system ATP-binding protein